MAEDRPHILLIMGSVRAERRCPQIARWVAGIAAASDRFACETIDLRDWKLPSDDEPEIPSKGIYAREHTRAWGAKVAGADGVVIVSPEYNGGYPAALKNALDHVYKEWNGKPLAIVTYGGQGGGRCAAQLRQVAGGLRLRPVETMPAITVARDAIEANAPLNAEDLAPFEAAVRQAFDELHGALTEKA